jgi:hypothetical protein
MAEPFTLLCPLIPPGPPIPSAQLQITCALLTTVCTTLFTSGLSFRAAGPLLTFTSPGKIVAPTLSGSPLSLVMHRFTSSICLG